MAHISAFVLWPCSSGQDLNVISWCFMVKFGEVINMLDLEAFLEVSRGARCTRGVERRWGRFEKTWSQAMLTDPRRINQINSRNWEDSWSSFPQQIWSFSHCIIPSFLHENPARTVTFWRSHLRNGGRGRLLRLHMKFFRILSKIWDETSMERKQSTLFTQFTEFIHFVFRKMQFTAIHQDSKRKSDGFDLSSLHAFAELLDFLMWKLFLTQIEVARKKTSRTFHYYRNPRYLLSPQSYLSRKFGDREDSTRQSYLSRPWCRCQATEERQGRKGRSDVIGTGLSQAQGRKQGAHQSFHLDQFCELWLAS